MLQIDHLVFAARSLEEGTSWMRAQLGCGPGGGGRHPLMGTHNRLWRLEPGAYLEVIAVDPDATPPGRPRWFTLDREETRERMEGGPVLLTWVARSDDLEADLGRSPRDPGAVTRFTRDDLHWRLTVPADGGLAWGGAYPSLIHWPEDDRRPARTLPENGLFLEELRVHGPAELHHDLAALGAEAIVASGYAVPEPSLSAVIRRPDGREMRFGE